MKIRSTLNKFSFLLPALVLVIIFVIYPIIGTVLLSFNLNPIPEVDIVEEEPSFKNYYELFTDSSFINSKGLEDFSFPLGALLHNIIWVAIHLPLIIILGLILAVALQNVKGKVIVRSFIFLGMVVPMIVGGLIIQLSFDKDLGAVNFFLKIIGLDWLVKSWTIYPDTALIALIFGSVWLWTGFSVTLYSAGLASIPKEIIEAAIVDGASFLRILFNIIIPLLRPVTLTIIAMTIMWDLKIFDIVFASTQGGPGGASSVLAILMYKFFTREQDYAMSATVATVLTLIIIPVVIFWIRMIIKSQKQA